MFETTPYEQKMDAAVQHFGEELKKVRTGRAHPAMLESVMVEAYSSKMPLNQVANVTAPEAQMLLVTPFDPSNVVAISAAIRDAQSLGFNPTDDGKLVRVPVPPLTEERRRELVKQIGAKAEDARVALRNIRQDGIKDAKRRKDAKELSEDDARAVEKQFDTFMQEYQVKIEQAFKAKEQEVLTI